MKSRGKSLPVRMAVVLRLYPSGRKELRYRAPADSPEGRAYKKLVEQDEWTKSDKLPMEYYEYDEYSLGNARHSTVQEVTCSRCKLAETRSRVVWGAGSHHSGVMLIGEAPGAKEDETGSPFVGKAGEILNRLLAQAGLNRENVWVTNAVKCRSPEGRQPDNVAGYLCSSWLKSEIEVLDSSLLVTLGASAAKTVMELMGLDPPDRMAEAVEGMWQMEFLGRRRLLIPAYSLEALLHNKALEEPAMARFEKVGRIVRKEWLPPDAEFLMGTETQTEGG